MLIVVQDKFALVPDDNTGVSLTIMAGPEANGQISGTIYIVKVMKGGTNNLKPPVHAGHSCHCSSSKIGQGS